MIRKLPSEIWLYIFEYLQWPQHQFASMVSISPYTKATAETILYRNPRIRFSLQSSSISHLVEQFHRKITKGNGHLAAGVRTFRLSSTVQRRLTTSAHDGSLTAALLLCMRKLKRLEVICHGMILIPPIVDPSDRFISITHLCWSVEVDDAILFAAFLGSLPSLEYMIAGGDGIRFIPLAPAALPLLHHLVNASPDFAESVLTGRDVPNLGLVVNNVRLFAPIFDANNEYDSSTLTTMKCVKSLSMSSDKLNCSLLMECASLFREVKYLKISPEAPLEAFAMPQLYDTRLCKTRVQSLELCAVCSDDAENNIESLKQLFSALPSLQTLVFRRVNGDSEDGFYQFCRDKLDDGPEWNEGGESEETTEDDEWQI